MKPNTKKEITDPGIAKFSTYILVFDILIISTAGYPVYIYSGSDAFTAMVIGFVITTFLAIISFIPFTRIRNGSMNRYMIAMLVGMMVRMIFIAISVVFVFIYTELHQIAFTVGLLFSYICKIVIETYMITRKTRGYT